MVHRCLLIPEILGLLCEVLREDCTTGLLNEQLATLAALARTCRAFEGPALDSLWREINGLRPLLCTMPLDLFKMEENFPGEKKNLLVCTIANYLLGGISLIVSDSKCLRRTIVASDLKRFPSYTHRIHNIRFEPTLLVDVEVIQALSMTTLHIRPLFPNVKHLVWHSGNIAKAVETSLLQCIDLFCSRELATLDIFLRNSFDTTYASIFSDLINC